MTARVRIFSPDEFSGPEGWPEDVGIAVLQTGEEPEIFPVHRKESPAAVLSRLQTLTSRMLGDAAVFPPVDGHPECDLPFTAVAKLRSGIEHFLARSPDAVEEAADFSVNFGFATDEGLDLSTLVRMAPQPAQVPETPAEPEAPELPGYAPFNPEAPPSRKSIPALLCLSATGELVIVTDPNADPVKMAPSDVLVRDDGLALALRRSAFGESSLPGYILLPSGCLGIDPPTTGSPVLIMPSEKHYLVTPVADSAEQEVPDQAPMPPEVAAWPQSRFALFANPRRFAALAGIAAGVLALFLMDSTTTQMAEKSVDPLHLLRAELFQ